MYTCGCTYILIGFARMRGDLEQNLPQKGGLGQNKSGTPAVEQLPSLLKSLLVTWTDHLHSAVVFFIWPKSFLTLPQRRFRSITGKWFKPPHRLLCTSALFSWNRRATVQLPAQNRCVLQVPIVQINWSPITISFLLQGASTVTGSSHQPDFRVCSTKRRQYRER